MKLDDKSINGKVIVTDIVYDFEGETNAEDIEVPDTLEYDVTVRLGLDVNKNGEILEGFMDEISDWISDDTGWCHQGFNAEFVFNNPNDVEDTIK